MSWIKKSHILDSVCSDPISQLRVETAAVNTINRYKNGSGSRRLQVYPRFQLKF